MSSDLVCKSTPTRQSFTGLDNMARYDIDKINAEKSAKALQNMTRKLDFRPGVAVFVPDIGGRFPMGRRKTGKHDDGLWCLPGGGMEWGEDLCTCTVRETREETGIEVVYMGQICTHTWWNEPVDKYHLTIYTLASAAIGDVAQLAEPDKFYEWKMFSYDDMPVDELAFPCTRPAAARFVQVLANKSLLIPPEWGKE